jgi:tripartite-type tricarboxylate transporter receptor subunit TctC
MRTERLAACVVLAAASGVAVAQSAPADYPNRPIRFVVAAAPGGSSDGASRVIGVKLTERWGQQVVIDNRGGAGGIIGAQTVAQSAPDGYTIGMVSIRHSVNPSLLSVPFDAVKDFTQITMTAEVGNVLVVNAKSTLTSVKDIIAQAKEKPGALTFASSGIGGAPHLTGEFFALQTGVKLTHIAYKGGGPAVADLVAGAVTMSFASMTSAVPHIRSGRLRALAVASKDRSALLPEVPTMKEAGVPNVQVRDWQGVIAPKGLSKGLTDKLSTTIRAALKDPEMQPRLAAMGLDVIASTPEEFRRTIEEDVKRWAVVVKQANIKAD